MPSPAELARRIEVALTTPHVPRAQREGRPSPSREIMCRACARWTTIDPGEGVTTRHHTDDGTPSCVPFA